MAYCIDQDPAGSKFVRHTVRAFRVGRAYVGDEPEFRVVGYFNGFSFRLANVNIDKIVGPKISSFAIRMSRATLANTVGFTEILSSKRPEG